jgi:hypothetical protein
MKINNEKIKIFYLKKRIFLKIFLKIKNQILFEKLKKLPLYFGVYIRSASDDLKLYRVRVVSNKPKNYNKKSTNIKHLKYKKTK